MKNENPSNHNIFQEYEHLLQVVVKSFRYKINHLFRKLRFCTVFRYSDFTLV